MFASVRSAAIHVDTAHLNDLADVKIAIDWFTRDDHLVLQGGWLADERTLVAQLGLQLPKTGDELVNQSVTNGSLAGLCDLQLDVGVTVSGVRDRQRTTSLGYPVKIYCD